MVKVPGNSCRRPRSRLRFPRCRIREVALNNPRDPRFDQIINAIASIGMGRFDISLPTSDAGDELDAIALGLTMLSEELKQNIDEKARVLKVASLKSGFFASLSHEIRTPLNGIGGLVEMLRETELSEKQLELVEMLSSTSDLLLAIVNEVLDFSKIENNGVHLRLEETDLMALADHVLDVVRTRARNKGIRVDGTHSGLEGVRVRADGGRLQQVLVNLLGNAVKFTDHGRICLAVDAKPEPQDGAAASRLRVRFSVSDTGSGISPVHMGSLFQAYFQVADEKGGDRGGTGLGLPIAQSYVRAMGGEIQVESVVGQGSGFSFEVLLDQVSVPAEETDAPATALAGAGQAQGGTPGVALAEKKNDNSQFSDLVVLVAEDNLVNQRVIAHKLRRLGITCTLVADGASAVEAVQSGCYDLVLMDCMMPGTDGYSATLQIRSLPLAQQPYISALSSAVTEAEIERCFEVGMDHHLPKPFVEHQLIEVLEESCLRKQASEKNSIRKGA